MLPASKPLRPRRSRPASRKPRTASARTPTAGWSTGWAYPDQKLGDFGQDYDFRDRPSPWADWPPLVPAEAMYLRPIDSGHGQQFDGDGVWRVHLPDGGPPVDAFWSLTMYEYLPTKQHFLTHNPIDRYAIGDRTPGLKINADRSLDIWISRTDPAAASAAPTGCRRRQAARS